MSYIRFGLMILTSTLMMFILMYLNTFAWEHVFFSETRAYMALVMGATMAVIMLAFMLGMYSNMKLNIAIFAGSVVLFSAALWLVRSQVTVQDASYMRAMIPHHSIAIMTSERARISDPQARKLADEIIAAQQREIAEMRYLIADIEENGDGTDTFMDPPPTIGTIADALANTLIAELDPAPMTADEADGVLPPGSRCAFRRTAKADPILWGSMSGEAPARGVMELNGIIVPLTASTPSGTTGTALAAEGVSLTVRTLDEEGIPGAIRSNAELVFELDHGPTVGYRGFYNCQ